MIIQCEQCRTKFRLDDEKVTDRGVKVRCAKCRHVFVVRKGEEQTAAADLSTPVTAAAPAFEASDETGRISAPAIEPHIATSESEPAVAFDFGAAPVADSSFDLSQTDAATGAGFDFGDVSFDKEAPQTDQAVADFGEMTMVMPPKQVAEPATDLNLDFGLAAPAPAAVEETAFDFGDAFTTGADTTAQKMEFDFGAQPAVTAAPAANIDLGGFDFGDVAAEPAAVPSDIDATDFSNFTAAPAAPKSTAPDLGFSFDDVAPQAAASPADGFDFSGVDFGTAETSSASPAAKVDSFSLGEVDFSGDTAAVEVEGAATVSAGTLFAPVDEATARQQVAAAPDITFEAPESSVEPPPLAISSRRRQNSMASVVIAVVAIVVIGVLGYMSFNFISNGPKAVSTFGGGAPQAEEGKITVQNIKAYFISKSAAGELLVITGDALNSYKKPRAALQVKGIVFGANNQILATKIAYAGNQLTNEQLATMSVEKIEAAMSNQFGDSLANLEVSPGKTIPFTIVLVNPPKEGKDFGVEPVGSTVAASKQ